MRPLNRWLPQCAGLVAAAIVAVLISAPHKLHWLGLIVSAVTGVGATWLACAAVIFLCFVVFPSPEPKAKILRTSSIAACFAPLVILLIQGSLWAPLWAAFVTWILLPVSVKPKPYWTKFAISILASILLQVGFAAQVGERVLTASLILGIAAAPIAWRIRQERKIGTFKPRATVVIAFLLTIAGLTHYLPIRFGTGAEAASLPPAAKPAVNVGGQFRGVILLPEPEEHVKLVVPLPVMGRDLFDAHKDPIGIPFYGVYWFYQSPDRRPAEDAVRKQGSPDNITFRSADRTPLRMEARQNLGRLIDMDTLSRIDIAIRNADTYPNTVSVELVLFNGREHQSLGQQIVGLEAKQKLQFEMRPASAIDQFDELSIRFLTAQVRATKSARVAIERFFLVPRH